MKPIASVLDVLEIKHILSMDLILLPFRASKVKRQMMWVGLGEPVYKPLTLT